jgi:hypothetical protein
MWFIYSQKSPISYIENIPGQNGTYSLFLDNTCAGSIEVRSAAVPSEPTKPTNVFLTTIRAEIQGTVAPLTSSMQFHQGQDGFISSFLMTFVFPGISIESDLRSSHLSFTGHFFDEPIQFAAFTNPSLEFVHHPSGTLSITGTMADNPVERIIQLTIRKHLQRIRFADVAADCSGNVSFTDLVQQLMHIQHSLSSDILALQNIASLEERRT